MDDLASIPEYGWKNEGSTQAHAYLLPKIAKALSKVIINHKPLNVFDAGCGNGFIAGSLLKMGHRVTGCDSSTQGIDWALSTYPEGRFEVCSVYDKLSEKFGSNYDVVISAEVIEHLYIPRLFALNLFELLKPGGWLIITTPYHGYFKNLALAIAGSMDRHFTALWDGGHIKFWSYKTLKTLLSDIGFYDFTFYGAGRLPLLWKSMIVSARKP